MCDKSSITFRYCFKGQYFFFIFFLISYYMLVHSDYFSVFFGNSAIGALTSRCPPGFPGHANPLEHLVTGHVERLERWRHLGAAADLRPLEDTRRSSLSQNNRKKINFSSRTISTHCFWRFSWWWKRWQFVCGAKRSRRLYGVRSQRWNHIHRQRERPEQEHLRK